MMRKRRMRDRLGAPATVLGPGARLKGALQGEGHFLIAGEVVGDADVEGGLTLAEGGRWEGGIRADDVIIAGAFEGELLARGRIEITATARVKGRIAGNGIAVAAGASIEADLESLAEGGVHRFEDRRGP
jgi:cytoskeletal protein CcmA (bactofilin family)